ncbi:MAG: RNA pseudouridine synthase [Proteobacteria bacterium]|nr:RNA pseudouridine synthase [Pseudomonadota bacterium]
MALDAQTLVERILYRDERLMVLDKPAGIAVHKGPKGGVTLDEFLPALQFGKPELPQLAHRLDKDTTGCLVLGRDKAALKRLGQMFARGEASKTYCALVIGNPKQDAGRIEFPLARRSHDKRSWWMKVDASGDPSFTRYRVLARGDGIAFVALAPETGRTHQLRVHCAEMGWPIAGDRTYGGDRAAALCRAVQLHAWRIALPQGRDKPPLVVKAPLPEAMRGLIDGLGLSAQGLETLAEPME